jgi:hypothetical protein
MKPVFHLGKEIEMAGLVNRWPLRVRINLIRNDPKNQFPKTGKRTTMKSEDNKDGKYKCL